MSQDNPKLETLATMRRSLYLMLPTCSGAGSAACSINEPSPVCSKALDEITALIDGYTAVKREEAAKDATIALARKVLAVANYSIYRRGVTMRLRLDLLKSEMSKIIPDSLGITEERLP